jgi:phage-related protein
VKWALGFGRFVFVFWASGVCWWRVLYVAKLAEAVYVLHAFHKKTQKTRKEDIELARKRYRQIGGRS